VHIFMGMGNGTSRDQSLSAFYIFSVFVLYEFQHHSKIPHGEQVQVRPK
jgi:hypothetical protein